MNYSNKDIADAIRSIKAACDADQHGGVLHFTLDKLIEAGIIDTKPERTLDPFRPCPHDWTAFQVSIFDNGEPPAKRKRPVIQRTTMRWTGAIKVWTRENINFSLDTQVSWKANFYLWDASIANQVAKELHEQKYIDQETVDKMADAVAAAGDKFRYAIPVLKDLSAGSRWMRGHIMLVQVVDDMPVGAAFSGPNDLGITINEWSQDQANGKELAGKVVAQARIARDERFAAWSTQIVD